MLCLYFSISPVGSCLSCFPQSREEHISGCALFSLVSVTLTHLCNLVNFNDIPGSVVIERLLVFFFLNTPQCAIHGPASVCLCLHKGIVGIQPMQRRAWWKPTIHPLMVRELSVGQMLMGGKVGLKRGTKMKHQGSKKFLTLGLTPLQMRSFYIPQS